MSELLRVLSEEDVDDETLTEAANAAYTVLEARGVDVDGVAPVLREERPDPETTIVLSPVAGPTRRLRVRETDEPGAPYALEEDEWTGCAWRPQGRELLERVELDGEAHRGSGEVLPEP